MSQFVDTNVLIDIITNDPAWAAWSLSALETASSKTELWIDPIVYAELSVYLESQIEVDDVISSFGLIMMPTPREALFLAGKVHLSDRRRGGSRLAVLPDFLIGAHAFVTECSLITRDPRRFRWAFPQLTLIAPA